MQAYIGGPVGLSNRTQSERSEEREKNRTIAVNTACQGVRRDLNTLGVVQESQA